MTSKLAVILNSIVLFVTSGCDGILVGPTNGSQANSPADKLELKIKELDGNSTFYYDSDAFLLNKGDNSEATRTQVSSEANKTATSTNEATQRAAEHQKQFPPASFSSTSGRNGRMLDLDALMGDMTAAKANKQQRQAESGNRQSRYLSDVQSNLDIGGGKRLHIQGFIPIVGVKDDSDSDGADHNASGLMRQKPKVSHLSSNNHELPYGQSSMGHASFGVQRYLNTEVPQQQASQVDQIYAQPQQVDAKFSGAASVVDTLKRPIKKLTSFAGGSASHHNHQHHHHQSHNQANQNNQQSCLCVPFYMCKNGYITESSLGKTQAQQVPAQQHQIARQIDNMDYLKRGSVESIPVPMTQPLAQQQPVAPVSLVDERSLDRDIITASPLSAADNQVGEVANISISAGFSMDATTTTTTTGAPQDGQSDLSSSSSFSDQPNDANNNNNSTLSELMNSNNEQQNSDFSQEILGRMLGLKANSRLSSPGTSAAAASATGTCGLLRTCCNIPANMRPSTHQDLYSNGNRMSSPNINQQVMLDQALQKHQAHQQQQQLAQYQQVPYGLPMASQISRMQQPANNLMIDNQQQQQQQQLAHRTSNQYPAATGGRFQSPLSGQQISQYTRAASPMQPLQSFQQLYQPPQNKNINNNMNINRQAAVLQPKASQLHLAMSGLAATQANSLGTRRLLEGRCGLRQSAGITGRVQNLAYHESSADFGEYPAQAAILKRLNGSESLFVCGGTLISQFWVATAAHCIKKHAQSDLKVRLGEWDVHRDDEFYPYVEKEVRDIVIHPEFTSGVYLVNDIALIRLDSPLDSSLAHVNPACLPTIEEQFNGQRCWVTGWGKDSFGQRGSFQAVLREVELPVIGHNDCELALRQTRLGPHYRLHSGFICAGAEGGKDACEGDGGSGLYCVQDGVIKVAGLVSWGIGCGQQGVPGVYVNLAHYRPWIENIISIDEDVYSKNSAPIATTTPQPPLS